MTRVLSIAGAALLGAACAGPDTAGPSPPAPSPPLTFTLSGAVYGTLLDGVREPVANVHVIREIDGTGHSGGWVTDADGHYAIPGLRHGSRVAVTAMAGAWSQPCAAVATIVGDTTLDVDLVSGRALRTPVRESPSLSGVVFKIGADGVRRPSPGRYLSFKARCGGLVLAYTYSDAEGRYSMCRLPPGPGCVDVNTAVSDTEYGPDRQVRVDVQGDMVLDLDADPE